MGRILGWVTGVAVLALTAGGTSAPSVGAAPVDDVRCAVTAGRDFERAEPERAGLDTARLRAALDFAAQRNRLNVKVFRHNCLIGEGPGNDRTDTVAWNVWSVTKSVVS